ncbi:class I SAM-dependent methyltransferase [Mycobacterium intracellulare]|uniref:Class I SAM-dependent methyltransferase n=1 Tax=Mycobacterium intracellulare TaxID=1767 RepID=A0AAE4RIE1_MYCIT|nr:class I SAM-dependent methyltransferase [Mycobacterium intracellulare]MCA2323149.1 class I SAM-dependent methyltransferase [Mycobacterium intracellulare]MCA2343979.1 class I SAM-dependent methyltransferase [Mycobacterium intracellulare]MDV6980177.1 class I SAM-dependent methyltransferase [Mycobacterium intracellulare]MDV6985799.1 class I SAM-dependent methyltransferase [Mycobacterium intracellulare]MDV7016205.1 class I SAM-dependent methyltransferase [Mycobacterium intracellulare]
MNFDERTQMMLTANTRNWDARAPVHARSQFYGIGDRDPMSWFAPFEWQDLGRLEGREVVHLQCHLGTETMAFALKGARITGLDFSGASLHEARRVARAAGLAIEYVHSDVYDAVEALGEGRFDIVYTGKGALCYLPDLTAWAQTIALLLKPGGFLYLAEFHPLFNALGPTQTPGLPDDLTIRHDYLGGRGAIERDSSHTYTDGQPLAGDTVHYEWPHGLGDVITAIARSGLAIESLTETCLLPWPRWPVMVRADNGWWAMPENIPRFPVLYGLKATKP